MCTILESPLKVKKTNYMIHDVFKKIRALFVQLENTSSRLEKESLIRNFKSGTPDLEDDLTFCLEVLDGKYKIGFTLDISDRCAKCKQPLGDDAMCHNKDCSAYDPVGEYYEPYMSVKEFCSALLTMEDHTMESISSIEIYYRGYGWFLNPLFNREWRLGIGKSLLTKNNLTPMLAKKFDPNKIPLDDEYYITEKLDGNRCLAWYDPSVEKWYFYSRSGKELKVDFDMKDLPKEYIYDGEILSMDQIAHPSQANFNTLSGIINSKQGDKTRLIYAIFDFVNNLSYKERTLIIRDVCAQKLNNNPSSNVMILPLLAVCNRDNLVSTVEYYLNYITSKGGEGVMVNLGSYSYQHKRTDKLLKVKNVYTMDMRVSELIDGEGKYAGEVGSLVCMAKDEYGNRYICNVGSGLSDQQRYEWSINPYDILGRIVEVAYFSVSQDTMNRGTNVYSLRFPRLKKVRDDKNETSID